MAVADYSNLTSITRGKVLPKIVDQIGEDNPLLGRFLNKSKLWNGGTDLTIPVKYRHNSQGGSYSGLDTLDTAQEKTRTRATYNIKQVYQPIVLSNIDLAKNKGENQVAPLMETELGEAKTSLQDKFGTQLFSDGTGNDSKDITGLHAAVDDATNVATYGGIARGTYTWWKANYTASVGSLMLSDLATMYDSCKSGQDSPSILPTTETIWSAYEALLEPQVRFTAQANGYTNGDGGMKSLSFRATPMISDEYCDSGMIYFLNEKYLQFYHMKHPKFPTDNRGFAVSEMREPVNQDGEVGFIFNYSQLVCDQPRKQGRLVGVTA